jgi:hypothetical protein
MCCTIPKAEEECAQDMEVGAVYNSIQQAKGCHARFDKGKRLHVRSLGRCPFAKPHGTVHSFTALRRLLIGGHSTHWPHVVAALCRMSIYSTSARTRSNNPVFRHRELTEICVLRSCCSGYKALRK